MLNNEDSYRKYYAKKTNNALAGTLPYLEEEKGANRGFKIKKAGQHNPRHAKASIGQKQSCKVP